MYGDPQGLREATVLEIDPDDEYPLTLCTCDIVLKGSHFCRITKYRQGKKVKIREEVVAKQLLMVNPSYPIMVGSCCYATTILGAWH